MKKDNLKLPINFYSNKMNHFLFIKPNPNLHLATISHHS